MARRVQGTAGRSRWRRGASGPCSSRLRCPVWAEVARVGGRREWFFRTTPSLPRRPPRPSPDAAGCRWRPDDRGRSIMPGLRGRPRDRGGEKARSHFRGAPSRRGEDRACPSHPIIAFSAARPAGPVFYTGKAPRYGAGVDGRGLPSTAPRGGRRVTGTGDPDDRNAHVGYLRPQPPRALLMAGLTGAPREGRAGGLPTASVPNADPNCTRSAG